MSSLAEDAAFRIMLRELAPTLKNTLYSVAIQTKEKVEDLYIVCRHKPGGRVDNPKDSIIEIKSVKTGLVGLAVDAGSAMKKENEDMLLEIFPVAKEFIKEVGDEWSVSVFDLFLMIRIKEIEGKRDNMVLSVHTRAGIEPAMKKTIM